MAELTKVRRVIAKQMPDAPHETLLTVDATTGPERRAPGEAVRRGGRRRPASSSPSSTARPRAASRWRSPTSSGIPVKLIGIGEQLEDLRPFDADDFARALLTA